MVIRQNIFKLVFIVFFAIIMQVALAFGTVAGDEQADDVSSLKNSSGIDALSMLNSITELQRRLKERIANKNDMLKLTTSDTRKKKLQEELNRLDEQYNRAVTDFERIATGVDIGLFHEEKREEFNWKDEVVSLIKPGVLELKRLTVRARQKTKIKEEISYHENLLPVAREASKNLKNLLTQVSDENARSRLNALILEWDGVEGHLENRSQIAKMQLASMEKEEKSFVESTSRSTKKFFRTRGRTFIIAIGICLLMIFMSRLVYSLMVNYFPGFNAEHRKFHIRAIDLLYRILSFGATVFAVIIVFYLVEDWVLLSLSILFLFSIGWAAKHTIPDILDQAKLIMNAGSVREGERIILYDVPWVVKKINIFSVVENPALGISLRIPIKEFTGKISRMVSNGEPWFPCLKEDWVILSDETIGKVISLSHEMVKIVQRGGATKIYQTPDFLALSPVNLSQGFRIKENFGISYDLQPLSTKTIPEKLSDYLHAVLKEEDYEKSLNNMRVEFAQAGSSSLDIAVIADFKGDLAPFYKRLQRLLQRGCVDACTQNNWEIPFPQLTLHGGMQIQSTKG